jgi:DNA-binding NtrC family response regulator
VQAKLLRALEDRHIERLGGSDSIPVDVRIVSATHRPLELEIERNNFRADLFYRLRVVTIDVPPLRERREDIPHLAETFARIASDRHNLPPRGISPAAMRCLVEYDWPGNVRELKNAVERAMVLASGDELKPDDLPDEVKPSATKAGGASSEVLITEQSEGGLSVPFTADFREDRREFERRYITRCLDESGGNVTRAAAMLGMHRQSLQHKLRELGLARRYVSVAGDEATGQSEQEQ